MSLRNLLVLDNVWPVIHISVLFTLVSCAEPPAEVQAPIDVSLETEDPELREFVADMHAKAADNSNSSLHRGRLGMAYDANGFTDVAAVTYRQARELDEDDMTWPYLESLALSELGRIDEALQTMDVALRIDSMYLPAHLAKGYWLIDIGEFQSACETFESASTVSNSNDYMVALQLGLAQCQLELGETHMAMRTIETLPSTGLTPYAEMVKARVKRVSGGSGSSETIGNIAGGSNQISWSDPVAGAVVEYTRGLSGESILARRLIEGGRVDDALRMIEDLQTRYPNEPHLIELHSAALTTLDRRSEALEALQSGVRLFPDSYVLQFNLGLLFESLDQFENALNRYDEALRLKVDFIAAYDAKAMLLLSQTKNGMARDVLEASLKHRSPDARTFYLLGVIYGGEGNWEQSAEYLTNASELEPNNVDVLASLALSLGELGRVDDAIVTINRAHALAPNNSKVARSVATLRANGTIPQSEQ